MLFILHARRDSRVEVVLSRPSPVHYKRQGLKAVFTNAAHTPLYKMELSVHVCLQHQCEGHVYPHRRPHFYKSTRHKAKGRNVTLTVYLIQCRVFVSSNTFFKIIYQTLTATITM